jgi:hypothetical protein
VPGSDSNPESLGYKLGELTLGQPIRHCLRVDPSEASGRIREIGVLNNRMEYFTLTDIKNETVKRAQPGTS